MKPTLQQVVTERDKEINTMRSAIYREAARIHELRGQIETDWLDEKFRLLAIRLVDSLPSPQEIA